MTDPRDRAQSTEHRAEHSAQSSVEYEHMNVTRMISTYQDRINHVLIVIRTFGCISSALVTPYQAMLSYQHSTLYSTMYRTGSSPVLFHSRFPPLKA